MIRPIAITRRGLDFSTRPRIVWDGHRSAMTLPGHVDMMETVALHGL